MKAAIYARYSTEKQSESSIDDQHRECRKLAERHEFNVVAVFSDKALSGGTANRPDYQSMLVSARAGQFDILIPAGCVAVAAAARVRQRKVVAQPGASRRCRDITVTWCNQIGLQVMVDEGRTLG